MNYRKITNLIYENSILLFLIFTILPFLILSAYVHPCWDDFEYSELSYKNGFFESQYMWYVTWSGRYFSQAVLSSLNPLIFRSIAGYKIITFLFITVFIISVYFVVSGITSGKLNRKQKSVCTFSFCYLFFYGMPTVNLGLFWLASSVIYQLANILMLILTCYYLKFLRSEKNDSKTIIAICFLIIAIIGCNEVSMLILVLFFIITFIFNVIISKKINKYLLLFALVSVVSFMVVYFAPGNSYRLTTNPNSHQLIFSLKNSISDLIKFILYRLYNLPLLIFTVLFISFYIKFILNGKSFPGKIIINPFYSVSLYLIVLFSGIFVSYWSLGTSTPFRTLNVIYFVFLTGWFLNIVIILNFINSKKQISGISIPAYASAILCLAVFLSFMKETNSIKTAYKDLLNGTATVFDKELNKRYSFIHSETADTVRVDSLSRIPDSFFYYDIGSDPGGKYNKLQSEYFSKKFIIKK